MNTIYAALRPDGFTVSHVIDFKIYGDNWREEKTLFEENGMKFIELQSDDDCSSDDLYDAKNNRFISSVDKDADFIREQLKIENSADISRNDYFLVASHTSQGLSIIDKDKFVDIPAKFLYSAVNCQLMPDGGFVVNEFNKTSETPFFTNIYLMDKDRNVVKHLECPYHIDHECIVGTNTPRYYSPEFDYSTANENILIVTMSEMFNESVADEYIFDNSIVEMDFDGNILWQWNCAENFDKFGFTDEEKLAIRENPVYIELFGDKYDWIHLNGVCSVGANKWYDAGDERFHPDNLICCSRNRSLIFIISKETGEIVWKIRGTDLNPSFEMPHYAHIIPKGLKGAGNLLFFDNGNFKNRDYARIIELNPITHEIVYMLDEGFNSAFMSSVQKLDDGNYLIGSSVERKVLVVDENKNILSECRLDAVFYRINAYPRNWFVQHEYSDEDIEKAYTIANGESKYVSNSQLQLAELYIDQYIMYNEALLNLVDMMNLYSK